MGRRVVEVTELGPMMILVLDSYQTSIVVSKVAAQVYPQQ